MHVTGIRYNNYSKPFEVCIYLARTNRIRTRYGSDGMCGSNRNATGKPQKKICLNLILYFLRNFEQFNTDSILFSQYICFKYFFSCENLDLPIYRKIFSYSYRFFVFSLELSQNMYTWFWVSSIQLSFPFV